MRKMISRLFHLCTALLTSPLTGVGYSRCVDPISSYSEPCCPLTRPLALRVCFYCVTAQRLMVTSAHHLLTMWSGDGSFHPAPGPVTSFRLTCLTKEPRTGAQEGAGGRGLRAPAARRPHLHGHRGAIPAGSGRASGSSFPPGRPLSLSLLTLRAVHLCESEGGTVGEVADEAELGRGVRPAAAARAGPGLTQAATGLAKGPFMGEFVCGLAGS